MNPLASLRDWLDRRRETMECRAAVELMTDYLEGALDDRAEQDFESHLAGCPACTAYRRPDARDDRRARPARTRAARSRRSATSWSGCTAGYRSGSADP